MMWHTHPHSLVLYSKQNKVLALREIICWWREIHSKQLSYKILCVGMSVPRAKMKQAEELERYGWW